MAIVVEKLIKYFSRWHSLATVVQAANLVNLHFPDAKGFIDDTLHESRFAFMSEGSAYYCAPEKCKVYYNAKKSEALNPKFVFSAHTKEVDFSQKMKSTLLIYRQRNKKQAANDWKKEAAANKKDRQENVDALLAAQRDGARSPFGNLAPSDTSTANDPYEITDEEPAQPDEPEAIKITSLDDVKKINKERKPKKPKKAKRPPKKKKEPATKGIW